MSAEAAKWIDEVYAEIGENDDLQDVKDWLGTGFLPLNYALSNSYENGFPMGRITEIFGGESCGKTMLATYAMVETQKKGGLAVFLDFEHAFAMKRAKQLGLSDERGKWIFKQPETAEEGFKLVEYIAEKVASEGIERPVTIVIDSVAAMITKEELETEYGKENMRTNSSVSRLMSTALKKLTATINNTNTTLIFLNQVRDNPGVMFGDKEKTTGGRALRFYASVRIKLTKVGKVKDGDDVVGENVSAEVVKNKVGGAPFARSKWQSSFKEGIDIEGSHVEALIAAGKLTGPKGYIEFGGKKWRQKALVEELKKDNALYESLLAMFTWE